jgi:hypothetical protein
MRGIPSVLGLSPGLPWQIPHRRHNVPPKRLAVPTAGDILDDFKRRFHRTLKLRANWHEHCRLTEPQLSAVSNASGSSCDSPRPFGLPAFVNPANSAGKPRLLAGFASTNPGHSLPVVPEGAGSVECRWALQWPVPHIGNRAQGRMVELSSRARTKKP